MILESSTITPAIKFAACDVYLRLAFPSQAATAQTVFPTLIDLILKESDNNIKLIILEKLSSVFAVANNTLDTQLLDLWKVFSRYSHGGCSFISHSSDIEIKRRSLFLVLDHCTEPTAATLSDYLSQEIMQLSLGSSSSSNDELKVLVSSLSKCALYSKSIVHKTIPVFCRLVVDKLGTTSSSGTSSSHLNSYPLECVEFFKYFCLFFISRASLMKYPSMNDVLIPAVISVLPQIRSAKCFKAMTWIIGEYGTMNALISMLLGGELDVDGIFKGISSYLNELSELISSTLVSLKGGDGESSSSEISEQIKENGWKLQVFLENGCLGPPAALAFSILKLFTKVHSETKIFQARASLLIIGILKILKNLLSEQGLFFASTELKINFDALDRLAMCLKLLSGSSDVSYGTDDDGIFAALATIFDSSKLGHSMRSTHLVPSTTHSRVCF